MATSWTRRRISLHSIIPRPFLSSLSVSNPSARRTSPNARGDGLFISSRPWFKTRTAIAKRELLGMDNFRIRHHPSAMAAGINRAFLASDVEALHALTFCDLLFI
jgi:hypothetical protein